MAINNRYEFMFYIQCVNGNPNGDPDMGNSPRMDPEDMHGYITDVAIKRRIRNYIQTAFEGQDGMNIIMQNATNINKAIAKAKETAGVEFGAKDKDSIYKARKEACAMFYDVRTIQRKHKKALEKINIPLEAGISETTIFQNITCEN